MFPLNVLQGYNSFSVLGGIVLAVFGNKNIKGSQHFKNKQQITFYIRALDVSSDHSPSVSDWLLVPPEGRRTSSGFPKVGLASELTSLLAAN